MLVVMRNSSGEVFFCFQYYISNMYVPITELLYTGDSGVLQSLVFKMLRLAFKLIQRDQLSCQLLAKPGGGS